MCIPENTPGILPVRRSQLALVGRKQTAVRDISFSLGNLSVRACDSRAQAFSTSLARRRPRCLPRSPNLVLTRLLERATVRLRVLMRPTRISATVPPASRVPSTSDRQQIGARKRHIWRTQSSTNQTAAASSTDRLNREDSQLVASFGGESTLHLVYYLSDG